MQVKAFIEACDNQVVEQAFQDTKHIVHDEFCDAVTSLRRTALKELTHVEELTKVFSEDVGPAIDQLTKSLYNYMQSECRVAQRQLVWPSLLVFHIGMVACHIQDWCVPETLLPPSPPIHPPSIHSLPVLLQCSPSESTSPWHCWKVRIPHLVAQPTFE